MCGEQFPPGLHGGGWRGSPPRVRGTEGRQGVSGNGLRITPACAGNSVGNATHVAVMEDHPRVCGEQSVMALRISYPVGSPPRVRGTEKDDGRQLLGQGITPACAGNSWIAAQFYTLTWDHPRVCGEQAQIEASKKNELGSPPRVRGTVAFSIVPTVCLGITPACAGNRSTALAGRRLLADHPRVCGEQPN